MLTFILFFSFVVNTGMLVNAKINLQNAADLAAYAGASVQARQLTDISYLNYEMRRQFKKFLFRYYVIGNMSQRTHPTGPIGGVRDWRPAPNATPFNVPAVCVTFNSGDNYCQIERISAIQIPPSAASSPDQIMNALAENLTQFERARKKGCVGIGQTNMMLLYLWLLNTDINLENVTAEINSAGDPEYAARMRVLRTLAAGLGLIPKELLLRKRIDTLNRYVNFAPQTALDISRINSLQGGTDWAAKERPIQAFLSAYHSLGNNTFTDSDIIMDELLPGSSDGATLLKLGDIRPTFDTFAVDLAIGSCGLNRNSDRIDERDGDCVQCLSPYSLQGVMRPVVGVFKDPAVRTYYALRLTAKAKILFSPFGDMTLKAYAAAQPFGSRIGPRGDLTSGEEGGDLFFTSPGRPPAGNNNRCFGTSCFGRIPNLPVKAGESNEPSSSSGWNQNDVIGGYFSRFAPQIGNNPTGPVPSTLSHQDMMRAYHIAMSPNPWESGKYNIANDLVDDPFVETFNDKSMHAIWAPIFNASSNAANSNPTAEITQMIEQFGVQDENAQALFTPAAKQALVNGIQNYVNQFLTQGNGEDGEGSNVFRFYDPFKTRPENNAAAQPISGLNPSIYMSEPEKVRTSWSDVLSSDMREKGRSGYSVKFIPLKLLRTGENRIPSGTGVDEDIEFMQH